MIEWNLSDRIINQKPEDWKHRGYPLYDPAILKEDVREFIKRLKEFCLSRNHNLEGNKNNPRMNWKTAGSTEISNILFTIDKLAGEKLI